jgi:transcription elongation factor Elf1
MAREIRQLTCPHCGETKAIEVAVSGVGSLGPIKCDDCKRAEVERRAAEKRAKKNT